VPDDSTRIGSECSVPLDRELTEDDNLARLVWRRASEEPGHPSFQEFVGGAWRTIRAGDHRDAVAGIARGLVASGVAPSDRVALMCGTRYEWLLVDGAVWAAGGATVPIYPSSSAAQVAWIVQDSGAKVLLVEDAAMRTVAADAGLDGVEVLVIDEGALDVLRERGSATPESEIERRVAEVTLDQPASIIYTSGTTGRPKGCVITHRNLATEAVGLLSQPIGVAADPGNRYLAFLPMAHVLARAITYAVAQGGATVGFWGDFKTIVDKFESFQPDIILGVPRVFEKVHAGIRAKAHAGGAVKAKIFDRAEQVAIAWSRAQDSGDAGLLLRAQHALLDRLVYGSVRAALGGRCGYALSGGGALREDLQHFFSGLGVDLYEGYGLTETCAAITVNQPTMRRIGTVGRPIAGNAVRIAESGEIELQGGVVFAGYWANPDATAEAFTEDGWFRTGDLGALDDDGYLRITGRAKEIIVTAGGKNVAPGPLEEVLGAHPLVGNAMVVGEGRPFVAALLTLDPEAVRGWATDRDKSADLAELADDEDVRAAVQSAVDDANALVSRAEGIRKFVVLPTEFTEEGGELTATMKVKRHVVSKQYAEQIEALYTR
jgi:long-chain acyl-CoA synthetase